MRTKMHWPRKSQQPLVMAWTTVRGKTGTLICNCTTDKKNDIFTTDRVITYFEYENSQITDKVNSG